MKIQYTWKCKYCEFFAESRRKLQNHHKDFHHFERYKNKDTSSNSTIIVTSLS